LDDRAAAMRGGEHGPAIVSGRGADSPLIQYVSGAVDDMIMPPPKSGGRRLTSKEIDLLRAWIDQGAPWDPESGRQAATGKSDFWAFRAPVRQAIPCPTNSAWARNEIDQFILSRLEHEGLAPAPEADRRTLIRRATFDLTGLPPTPAEVESFVSDSSVGAYERLIERLLSSPRYGERWARHWLDVVHYGETHGYDKDKPRPAAWPYRDYVIRAFNQDKPYARFVEEQVAGDILYPDEPDGVAALGFIAAGPWDFVGHVELPETKTDGLIARYNDRDDMVMTTMSTFQSLTVHCARCHDHKFDPISQEDYYSLQAVFAGVDRAERWFDSDKELYCRRKGLLARQENLSERKLQLEAKITQTSPAIFGLIDARKADLKKQRTAFDKANADTSSPSNGFHSQVASQPDTTKWVQIDLESNLPVDQIRLIAARPTDFPDTPGFGFPVRFRVEISDGPGFENPTLVFDQTGTDYLNPADRPVAIAAGGTRARSVRVTATRLWERTGDYVFALAEVQVISGGKNVAFGKQVTALDSIESGRWAKAFLVDDYGSRERLGTLDPAELAAQRKKRQAIETELDQLDLERKQLVSRLVDRSIQTDFAEVERELAAVDSSLRGLPPAEKVFAAANSFAASGSFHPAKVPRTVSVLRRGDVKQPIRPAEPGALSCFTNLPSRFQVSDPNNEGARRGALAKWLTSPKNPLTLRSIVNRVWQDHFGRGIVDTPNDFGHMGSMPSHPELLDWLTFWFAEHGQSLKELHRLLMTSAAYRQSVAFNPAFAKTDADNRLLWRMNRTRLDADELRDSVLFVSGQLDLTEGGPSVQQFFFKDDHSPVYDYSRFDVDRPEATRRSIYRFVVRSVPDPFMETLDCPDASLLAPKREATVTALQALTLLNDPLVLRQAEHLADRIAHACGDTPAQIDQLFAIVLARRARPWERTRLANYADEHGLANVCRLLLNSSEFMFLD
jgi:hypothetical protein